MDVVETKRRRRSRRWTIVRKPNNAKCLEEARGTEISGKLGLHRHKLVKCPRMVKCLEQVPKREETDELNRELEEHKSTLATAKEESQLLKEKLKLHYELATYNEHYLQFMQNLLALCRPESESAPRPQFSPRPYSTPLFNCLSLPRTSFEPKHKVDTDLELDPNDDFQLQRKACFQAVSRDDWTTLEDYARKLNPPKSEYCTTVPN